MTDVDSQGQLGTVGICATCGMSITHPGPDGECVRCLVSFGFLADEHESERKGGGARVVPGPLCYAHFEVDVSRDGFPKILGAGAMAVTYCARDTVLSSKVALKVISRSWQKIRLPVRDSCARRGRPRRFTIQMLHKSCITVSKTGNAFMQWSSSMAKRSKHGCSGAVHFL